MPAEHLSIHSTAQNGIDILQLTGALTLRTLFDFQEATQKAAGPKTILNLTGVPYVDSAGLGAILSFHSACQRNGRACALTGLAPRVAAMIQVSRVDRLLKIFPTVRDAEEAFAR